MRPLPLFLSVLLPISVVGCCGPKSVPPDAPAVPPPAAESEETTLVNRRATMERLATMWSEPGSSRDEYARALTLLRLLTVLRPTDRYTHPWWEWQRRRAEEIRTVPVDPR